MNSEKKILSSNDAEVEAEEGNNPDLKNNDTIKVVERMIWIKDGRPEVRKNIGPNANIRKKICIVHGVNGELAYGLDKQHAISRFERGLYGACSLQELMDDEKSLHSPETDHDLELTRSRRIAKLLNRLIAVKPRK